MTVYLRRTIFLCRTTELSTCEFALQCMAYLCDIIIIIIGVATGCVIDK